MTTQEVKSYIESQIQMLKSGSVSTNSEANIKQKGMLYAYEDTLDKLNKIDS